MTHILLLGAGGLLGSNIAHEIAKSNAFQLTTTDRNNAAKVKFNYGPRELTKLLLGVKPDIVINCIAATSPDASLRTSFMVNSLLPIQLALFSRAHKYQTIHFSTNAVFSGKNKKNTENTFSIPRSRYGISKLLGDLSAIRSLVIRTSFVGVAPIDSVQGGIVMKCRTAKPNEVIHLKENYRWNGLTIEALVELIAVIIKETRNTTGIFHIAASTALPRKELIAFILARIARNDVQISSEEKKSQRNLTLETTKGSDISFWWAKTKYRKVPDLVDLLSEAQFN